MTIAAFNLLIDAYQAARQHTRWVIKNLDAPAIQTPGGAKAAYAAAMDQEFAALRELIEAARRLCLKGR